MGLIVGHYSVLIPSRVGYKKAEKCSPKFPEKVAICPKLPVRPSVDDNLLNFASYRVAFSDISMISTWRKFMQQLHRQTIESH